MIIRIIMIICILVDSQHQHEMSKHVVMHTFIVMIEGKIIGRQ